MLSVMSPFAIEIGGGMGIAMQKTLKLIVFFFLLTACAASPAAMPTVVPATATSTATMLPPMPIDERLDAFMEKMPVRTPQPREALPSEGVVEFRILHWNDFHGELGEHVVDGTWVPGAARLAAFVKTEEAGVDPNQVLLLDAGDWYEGSSFSRPSRGAKVLEFYKSLGVDAITLGNHEFWFGMPRFYQIASEAEPIDILSANLRREGINNTCSDQRILSPYQIYELGEEQGPKVRVAVIGVSIGNLEVLVYNDAWTTGICFQTPAGEIINIYDQLMETEHPDVLVVLSHSGLDEDLKIARDLNAAGKPVDLIIGGHSHDWMEEPKIVGNTYVVTAGELGRAVGEFDLTYDRVSKSLDVKWKQEIFSACSPEDPNTLTFLEDTVSATLTKRECVLPNIKNPAYDYLIDMPAISESVGFWTLGKGIFPASESGLIINHVITSHEREYPYGLFAHAPSELKYALDGKYISFITEIGINETACGDGASFVVNLDDREIYRSENMLPSDNHISLELDVSGGKVLTLRTLSGNDMSCDWTIWGDPYLVKK